MDSALQAAHLDSAGAALAPISAGLPEADVLRLRRAYELAQSIYSDKLLGTGEPALEHALGAANSLAALRLDTETRIAGDTRSPMSREQKVAGCAAACYPRNAC